MVGNSVYTRDGQRCHKDWKYNFIVFLIKAATNNYFIVID